MRRKKLDGEINGKRYQATTGTGKVAELSEAVVPILAQDINNYQFRFIGTGFFIGCEGLMITAKHVLDDVRHEGEVIGPIGVCHIIEDDKFYMRNIKQSFEYPNSDVAIVVLDQPRHKVTGEILKNKVVTLSFDNCHVGDDICTFAYPKSVVESDGKKHLMEFSPTFFEGKLVKEYPSGRDKTMLPNPCWQTDMHIHGGASGGPVFNSQGHVVGINSTSFGDTSCSFISNIYHIINLMIRNISVNSSTAKDYTFEELIKMGVISTKK